MPTPPLASKALATPSVKARALRLLAQREHSRAELERKLISRATARLAIDPGHADTDPDALERDLEALKVEVSQALDELEQHGLLSDARTADALVSAKASRYGGRRLKQMLQAKSLDPTLVSSTLARARETELDRAGEVWRRRFGEPAADLRSLAKQQRFLAGRGFDVTIIERVLKAAGRPRALGSEASPEADPDSAV